jgi:uncharacterized protein
MLAARLARITIFPIKSLDGIAVDEIAILPGGSLAGDRRFALFGPDGHVVNGKRTAVIHQIRATYDLAKTGVQLRDTVRNSTAEFSLVDSQAELGKWLGASLGIACVVAENSTAGFPDDTTAPGPTLISTATLREVASWFPGLSLDEARRRFRANLEIEGVEPFWEDRLVGAAGREIPFQVGDARWLGVNPCQRCVVPTRASDTGAATPQFQKTFASKRQAMLPPWAPADRFNHFYRLAVNTRLDSFGPTAKLRVGDSVTLL